MEPTPPSSPRHAQSIETVSTSSPNIDNKGTNESAGQSSSAAEPLPPSPDPERPIIDRYYRRHVVIGGGYGSSLSSIILLAFAIAGLALTIGGRFRGDHDQFVIGFSITLAAAAGEIILGFAVILFSFVSFDLARLINFLSMLVTAIGSIVAFIVLAFAMASGDKIPYSRESGCVGGFGCANVMAILCLVIYGLQLIGAITALVIAACAIIATSAVLAVATATAADETGVLTTNAPVVILERQVQIEEV